MEACFRGSKKETSQSKISTKLAKHITLVTSKKERPFVKQLEIV